MIEHSKEKQLTLVVENQSFSGVKKIAEKISKDFEKITNISPYISEEKVENSIIFATIGKSDLLDEIDISQIENKEQTFKIIATKNNIIVAGSDKLGTIYGMFFISEYIGISPLHFWGDVSPVEREQIFIDKDVEITSKVPSVKYRGFFINDEWPCFGTWTQKYGGFTAQMYDHVFELLLRLKGNYLWPAMWTSSFAVDGPNNLSEILADEYGITIGASHHEPMLRASEEWKESDGEWNWYTNKEKILKYWEEGLIRSGKYEKMITIGMRGERDSAMLGDAGLKENIDILKDIITEQKKLIKKLNLEKPIMLALYKEVEEYFYGNENIEGLNKWEGIEDVILLFCEDNFGFTRTLPTENVKNKSGMYYHFDYHGGPISYEWLPSTENSRVWHQMCKAYEHGVKEVWVVNVGDLKFNETSLNYFLDLAYDYEKWGISNKDSASSHSKEWCDKTFSLSDEETKEDIRDVLNSYIKINSKRRPEALSSYTYHAAHHHECILTLNEAQRIIDKSYEILLKLEQNEKEAYYSMIHIPAVWSMNLVEMQLFAARNELYAKQGRLIANYYARRVETAIEIDKKLSEQVRQFKNGKWAGMELEHHIGFTMWNEENSKYPTMTYVKALNKPNFKVSKSDKVDIYHKVYGTPMTIKIEDFLYAGNESVILELTNDLNNSYYEITQIPDWILIDNAKGKFEEDDSLIRIEIKINRENLKHDDVKTILIKSDDAVVAAEIHAKVIDLDKIPKGVFLENDGVVNIPAHKFSSKEDTEEASFVHIKNIGITGNIMTLNNPTKHFYETKNEKIPSLSYEFIVSKTDEYIVELWLFPENPSRHNEGIKAKVSSNTETRIVTILEDSFVSFHTDETWSWDILNNVRKKSIIMKFEEGLNKIVLSPLQAGFSPEKILIYTENKRPYRSYLGPYASFYK